MIEFTFSVRGDQGSPHQFDLGDMFVRGDSGLATSEGRVPDQGMMIHVSVADLLSQLREAYAARRGRGRFEFVGCDSSFQLVFIVRGKDITVRAADGELGTVRRLDLLRSALRAAQEFARTETARLDPDDAAYRDLHDELRRFEALLPGPPPPGAAEQLRLMGELDAGRLSVPAFGRAWWHARDADEHVPALLQSVLDEVFWMLEEYPLDPTLREPGDPTDAEVVATVRAALRKARR